MPRAAFCVGALLSAAAAAAAQDAWVSPKTKPTALALGDRSLEPAGNLKLFGAIRVHPALRETVLWDDNIFLAEDDPEADVISTTTAGLRLDALPGDFEIAAGSRIRWVDYASHSREDHPESVTEGRVAWTGRDLRIEATDVFEWLEEPLNLVTAERLQRWVNTATLAGSVRLRTLAADLRVEDRVYDFRKPRGALDHREDTASLTVRGEAAADLTFFGTYAFGLTDYVQEAANDYTTHEVQLGIRGRPGAKAEVQLSGGAIVQVVDAGTVNPDDTGYTGGVGSAVLSWTASPRLSFQGSWRRTLQFPQPGTFSVEGKTVRAGNWQVVDRGELSGEWRPVEKVVFRLFGAFENSDPAGLPPLRRVTGGATLDYDWQPWLAIGVGYEHRARWTRIDDASYRNNRAWVHLTVYL